MGVSEMAEAVENDVANKREGGSERLKLFISTPFRSFGTARLFPDSLFGVGDALKASYVESLVAEISAAAYGTEDMVVDEVEFGCGPASSLASEQLGRVMRTVRDNFRLAKDVRIHGMEVPGGLTVDYAGFCKNSHLEYLELELLSADVLALRAEGLPPAGEAAVACFQVTYFTGAPQLGILLDSCLDRDERAFRKSIAEALGRDPLFVRVMGLDKSADMNGRITALRTLCEKHGLAEVDAGALAGPGMLVYARKGFRGLPETHANQIGCGVNAMSIFDGIRYKTTGDLSQYLAHSVDFPIIARQV